MSNEPKYWRDYKRSIKLRALFRDKLLFMPIKLKVVHSTRKKKTPLECPGVDRSSFQMAPLFPLLSHVHNILHTLIRLIQSVNKLFSDLQQIISGRTYLIYHVKNTKMYRQNNFLLFQKSDHSEILSSKTAILVSQRKVLLMHLLLPCCKAFKQSSNHELECCQARTYCIKVIQICQILGLPGSNFLIEYHLREKPLYHQNTCQTFFFPHM